MKKTLLFLVFSLFLSAQNTQFIYLSQNIKDKKEQTKSLTFIDNRSDKQIGAVKIKKGSVELKFDSDDVKYEVENWFTGDNKNAKGENEVVILLEELKILESPEDKSILLKTKISSFLKKNNQYYLLNRYENVDGFDSKSTPRAVSTKIAFNMANLINNSYSKIIISSAIPGEELHHYESFLLKNYKVFNTDILTEGVYENFVDFRNQKVMAGYHTVKNKDSEFVYIENEKGVRDLDVFGFVEDGIPYKITTAGNFEIFRDEKGLYILSNRAELFPENTNGVSVGLMMGGGVLGAVIGIAIDSKIRKNNKNKSFYNVYIDSLTGDYVFSK